MNRAQWSMVLLGLVAPLTSHAIEGRAVGFGVSSQLPVNPTPLPLTNSPPALLSVRFAAIPRLEVGGLLGFSVDDTLFNLVPGARGNLVLFAEPNSNFYLAAQLALSLPLVGGGGINPVVASFFAGPGVEFRVPGVEHLELFADFGIAGFIANSVHMNTSGHLLGLVGFHYYFGAKKPEATQPKSTEAQVALTPDSEPSVEEIAGVWTGSWGTLLLKRVGTEVWGAYPRDEGRVRGTYEGGVFKGWWCSGSNRASAKHSGDVEFRFSKSSSKLSLDGRSRHGASSASWNEDWDLTKSTGPIPADLEARFFDVSKFCAHP
jgi:hypothetical protein